MSEELSYLPCASAIFFLKKTEAQRNQNLMLSLIIVVLKKNDFTIHKVLTADTSSTISSTEQALNHTKNMIVSK